MANGLKQEETKTNSCVITSTAESCALTLGEQFTIYEAAEIRDNILANWHSGQALTVDLSQTREFDTAGIQLLLALRQHVLTHHSQWQVNKLSEDAVNFLRFYNIDIANVATD
ncbi:STAS domain-containing protein [Alteromonadaceae bacterium 2753L.S.0a.02]|nr:STAS domain-containing protein [Alteromonadaceae bacterium 2753L.S.0a.02]